MRLNYLLAFTSFMLLASAWEISASAPCVGEAVNVRCVSLLRTALILVGTRRRDGRRSHFEASRLDTP